jgi:hypothetical protein
MDDGDGYVENDEEIFQSTSQPGFSLDSIVSSIINLNLIDFDFWNFNYDLIFQHLNSSSRMDGLF